MWIKRLKIIFLLLLFATTVLGYLLTKRFNPPHGLKGYYYPNPSWQGQPAFVKLDLEISPSLLTKRKKELAAPTNQFSIEWQGYLVIEKSGRYTFATTSDDGSSVYINDQLVVDNGGIHKLEEAKGQIYLKAGIYPIKVLYFQAGGSYGMDLSWAPWNQNLKRLPSYLLLS